MRSLLPIILTAFLIPGPQQVGNVAAGQNSASNLAGKLSDNSIALQNLKEQLSKDPEFAQNILNALKKSQNRDFIFYDSFDGGAVAPGIAPGIGIGGPSTICPSLQYSASNDDLIAIIKSLGGDEAYVKMVTDWEKAHTLSPSQRHDFRMKKIEEFASDLRKKAGQ